MEQQRKQQAQKKILSLEASFNKIREATHASELEHVSMTRIDVLWPLIAFAIFSFDLWHRLM